jgi:hypothetical protein
MEITSCGSASIHPTALSDSTFVLALALSLHTMCVRENTAAKDFGPCDASDMADGRIGKRVQSK